MEVGFGLSNSLINFPSDDVKLKAGQSNQHEGKEKAMRIGIMHFRYEII